MSAHAERVYTEPACIDQLESLVQELPANVHVALLLKDGSGCDGVVSTRPDVQVFRDEAGREGINALVQLERPDVADWRRKVWLDQIVRVEHLDSTMASES